MARKPDAPCAVCGKLTFGGKGALPPGLRTCQDCRRARSTRHAPCAGGCGRLVERGRGCLPPGERKCRECRWGQLNKGECAQSGCIRSASVRGLCKTHYNKAVSNPDRERARMRLRTHRRKDWARLTDITPEYEMGLRTRANRCPMPGCGVKLTDEPYLPHSKELDHIIPRGAGGTHTIGNVRIICRACNVRRPDDGSDYTGPVTLWAEVA